MSISKYERLIRDKLLTDYNSVYLVDYKNHKLIPYHYNNKVSVKMSTRIGESVDYEDIMNQFKNDFVIDDDKEKFFEQSNLDNIVPELEANGIYSHRFLRYNTSRRVEIVEGFYEILSEDDGVALLTYQNISEKPVINVSQMQKDSKNNRKRKILIVEDNLIIRSMLKEVVSNDYLVFEADNGLEALDILLKKPNLVSCILLDIEMPKMNGLEFLSEKLKYDSIRNIPVIVTTVSSDYETKLKCLELGAMEFITKPYIPNLVLSRIKNIIYLYESQQTLKAIEYDELTGIYVKDAFLHYAQEWIESRPDCKFDLYVANVSEYKQIIDTYGQRNADLIIKSLTRELLRFKKEFLIGRYGSHDIVLLSIHGDTDEEEELKQINERVLSFSLVKTINPKYGIYYDIDHNVAVSTLINRMIISLKTIEHQYGIIALYYDEEFQKKVEYKQMLENMMEQSLENNEFIIYYQPKHDAFTGKISGAEALVRWINPKYGFISPGDFIPLFEENGFVSRLDKYVLEKVCMDIKEWKEKNIPYYPISINTSRRDFFDAEYRNACLNIVRKNGIDFSDIHMEITESHYTSSNDAIIQYVDHIRKLGIKVEMDDFGVGYSSLGMIKMLPIDVIKMDMSFVKNLDVQLEVVETIIYLSHKIGCKVVAEGVETSEQLDKLKRLGCDYIQGYYFSKPIPKNDFEKYLLEIH